MVTTKENTAINIEEKNHKFINWRILFGALYSVLMIFALLLFFSALWYIRNYGNTGFDSVMFTLLSNMGGVNSDLLNSFFIESVLPTVLCGGVLVFVIFLLKLKWNWFLKIKFWHKAVFSLVLTLVFFMLAGTKVNVFGYIQKIMLKTTIYEDFFVEPSSEIITFPEEKRNLIYIFLESMETTYMSKAEGGALSENIIPELTKLAEENINFSDNDKTGGFLTPSGTGWTVAGMVAQTSGIPLKGSAGVLENNEYGKDSFLPGAVTLSDVLHQNGYKQALIVGSEASYANRDVYFTQHKTDHIYDLLTAKKDKVVKDDYYVWWGMEDEYLFKYAKEKITEISKGDAPFAVTLLTVDTHFPDGYVCDLCDGKFKEQYDNVIACASHQIAGFVDWLKNQSFYDDTTIVISGDHLSMDNQYMKRNVAENYDRRVYNCFINSAKQSENDKNRTFTSLDMFPTTLAAMGCEIKGDRLGLGTNLFSDRTTLAEEMGYDVFEHNLLFSSSFYIKKFMIGN